jgi:hypothetical protein
MPIKEVALAGFQSYGVRQSVPLDEHLTLLAGRNNVGKSALLRGIWAVGEEQFGAAVDFRLELTAEIDGATLATPFTGDPSLREFVERLTSRPSHTVTVELIGAGDRRGVGPLDTLTVEKLTLAELEWLAVGQRGSTPGWVRGGVPKAATGVREIEEIVKGTLRAIRYLAPSRIDPLQRSQKAAAKLSPEARNLADVLFYLTNNRRRRMEKILEFMRSSFPEIDHISVVQDLEQPSAIGEPTVFYRGREEGVPLRWCGSGVEQLLRFGVEVLAGDEPLLFLIDEPQAYLHPHAERQLLNLIDANRQHQYVIATHSHVLLNARPLSACRLVTIDEGQTTVTTPDDRQAVLSQIGVSPGDLGLAERVIWVEGPSEVAAFGVILAASRPSTASQGIVVKRMPVAPSQFTAEGRKGAVAYELCRQVIAAVRPLPIMMTFLFDRDEKTEDDVERIRAASRNSACFLDVRELENLFLDVDLLFPFLASLSAVSMRPAPTRTEVETQLQRLLHDHENTKLFASVPQATDDPLKVVRGYGVLEELTWVFATTRYDKTSHGEQLTKIALNRKPEVLAALTDLVNAPKPIA